jgi:hypothetical protein
MTTTCGNTYETYRSYELVLHSSKMKSVWVVIARPIGDFANVNANGIGKTSARALAEAKQRIDEAYLA